MNANYVGLVLLFVMVILPILAMEHRSMKGGKHE